MSNPTDLPAPLQPWRQWLGWFEPTLAHALGDLVRRLAELAGPASSASGRAAWEPDGLGDLRLRGVYERLLATEWLLADEIPDEFLRRAASAEHLFLAPQLRATPSDRVVVAVFDTGPHQLGSPRLAQLAAWVLLARRAADLGGALRWGLLHEPGLLYEAEGPERLRQLLSGRCLRPGDPTLEAQWKQALAPGPASPLGNVEAEIWWIGTSPPSAPPPARMERRLALDQTLSGDELVARLIAPTMTRHARLPLPQDDVVTGLLRGRFDRRPAPIHVPVKADALQRLALDRAPLIARFGTHVAVRALTGHALMVFKLTSQGQGRPRWRRQEWSSARPLVAVQLHKGQSIGLGLDESHLHFWQVERFATRQRPQREDFEPAVSAGRWMPFSLLVSGKSRLACVIDRRDRLLAWGPSPSPARGVDEKVLGMVNLDPERLVYAVFYGNGLWLRGLSSHGDQTPLRRRLCRLNDPRSAVFFALRQLPGGLSALGALAARLEKTPHEVWKVLTVARLDRALDEEGGAVEREVVLRPGEQVVGLVSQRNKDVALVVLSTNRRVLQLDTPEGRRLLFESAGAVTQCTVCTSSGKVAILTKARELIVVSATGERLLTVKDSGGDEGAGAEDD